MLLKETTQEMLLELFRRVVAILYTYKQTHTHIPKRTEKPTNHHTSLNSASSAPSLTNYIIVDISWRNVTRRMKCARDSRFVSHTKIQLRRHLKVK